MREFESVVYLDMQKTGTTSIVEFLRTVLRETETERPAHSAAPAEHVRSRYHFISVRHPLSLYISLFGHGVSGRGGLFKALKRRGEAEGMYEPSLQGFTKWLEFMLEPANAGMIRKRYKRSKLQDLLGPLSHRLLDLSIIDSPTALAEQKFSDRSHIIPYFNMHRLYADYIRTECLVEDLVMVFDAMKRHGRVKRRYRSISTSEQLAPMVPRNNVGAKIEGLSRATVPQELQDRVREREWMFFEIFGYDDPKGKPPPLPQLAVGDARDSEVPADDAGGRVEGIDRLGRVGEDLRQPR